MSFKELDLHEQILQGIEELGFVKPTAIQLQAIPQILSGRDMRASAQTGTGKTAAFILPALNRLAMKKPGRGPRILILVPTRELAMQVAEEAAKYSKYLPGIKTVCIYGGAPYPVQNRQLSRPFDILVATPGRLIDHLERGRIDFSRVELFILDEADRMLDMGFIEPVEQIVEELPKPVQTLLFSATLKGSVMNLSKRLLNDPVEIHVTPEIGKPANIQQCLYYVDNLEHKLKLLEHLLGDETVSQAIIFTATKSFADELTDVLQRNDHHVAALHGDLNQRKRSQTIARLREGKIKILVATDVAARGIDVKNITHVINFDLPNSVEDYVHRIGRTGRAEEKGVALSFVGSRDVPFVRRIEQFTGQKITLSTIPGMEAKMSRFQSTSGSGNGQQRFQTKRRPMKGWSRGR